MTVSATTTPMSDRSAPAVDASTAVYVESIMSYVLLYDISVLLE